MTDDIRIVPGHEYNSDPGRCVADYVRSLGDSRVGLSGLAGLSANFYLSLLRHLDGRTPVDFTLRMNRIRMVQNPAEVQLSEKFDFGNGIRNFCKYAERIFSGAGV